MTPRTCFRCGRALREPTAPGCPECCEAVKETLSPRRPPEEQYVPIRLTLMRDRVDAAYSDAVWRAMNGDHEL